MLAYAHGLFFGAWPGTNPMPCSTSRKLHNSEHAGAAPQVRASREQHRVRLLASGRRPIDGTFPGAGFPVVSLERGFPGKNLPGGNPRRNPEFPAEPARRPTPRARSPGRRVAHFREPRTEADAKMVRESGKAQPHVSQICIRLSGLVRGSLKWTTAARAALLVRQMSGSPQHTDPMIGARRFSALLAKFAGVLRGSRRWAWGLGFRV